MIPKNIKREHIFKAMEEVKILGVPENRNSKKFRLNHKDRNYPPKYIISLANKYANDKELKPSEFSGGSESNDFLKNLGFNVIGVQSFSRTLEEPVLKEHKRSFIKRRTHDERCPECKKTVKKTLKELYGKVQEGIKFKIGTDRKTSKMLPITSI